MKAKQLSIIIALAFGLLTVFILPLANWQGQGAVYAQEPEGDVGAADANTAVITLTPTIPPLQIPVNGIGTSSVIISNTLPFSLTKVNVEILYPTAQQFVAVNAVRVVRAGDILNMLDNSPGRLAFEIDFTTPISGEIATIAEIDWRGLQFSNGPKEVRFGRIEVRDDTPDTAILLDSQKFGTQVEVIRPPINVFIDPIFGSTCSLNVGQTFTTQVIGEDLYSIDQVRFEIDFDERFIQVNEVTPGGFFGSSPIEQVLTIDNTNGRLIFDYKRGEGPADATRATIANIVWEGVSGGTSNQSFVAGTIRMFANGVPVLDPPTPITSQDGCNLVVNPQVITIFLDPSNLTIAADGTATQDVRVRGVFNLDQVQFRLSFNPAVVEVVDADGQPGNGVQIGVGPLFSPFSSRIVNDVNNDTGIIDFKYNSDQTIRQDGIVARITWKAKQAGSTTNLTFGNVDFRDSRDQVIANIKENGSITVQNAVLVPTVFLNPENVSTTVGGTVKQNVEVANIDDLKRVDFRLLFDPSVAKVVDADGNSANGVQIKVGPAFGSNFTQVANTVDNSTGVIDFEVDASTPFGPAGVVAEITWQGVANGQRNLTFNNVTLLDSGFNPIIPGSVRNGTIAISGGGGNGGNTGDDISGVVIAEGRNSNLAGTQIFVGNQSCDAFTPSGSPTTTTDASGNFGLDGNTSFGCLKAVRQGHLVGERSNPSGELGRLELLAGDLDGDNRVGILDLARAASVYQKPDAVADFNGNGTVDILDLSLIARNYGKTGPVSNWQ